MKSVARGVIQIKGPLHGPLYAVPWGWITKRHTLPRSYRIYSYRVTLYV